MSAPVRHTCQNIDKVIKAIKDAISYAVSGKKCEDEKDKNDEFDNVIYYLDDLPSMLEDLRSDNDALRSWGHDLEKQIKELEELTDEL